MEGCYKAFTPKKGKRMSFKLAAKKIQNREGVSPKAAAAILVARDSMGTTPIIASISMSFLL